jgi:hypothetical protein
MGTGWCGVFKWCRAFAARSHASLETDPTLPGFDLFVIHLDGDVADKSYTDGGEAVSTAAQGLPSLPCAQPCPPPAGAADELRKRVLARLPKGQRIKTKSQREYREHAGSMTREWTRVTRTCTQAERFHRDVHAALDAGPVRGMQNVT